MQQAFSLPWIPAFNIDYALGIDGISFPLVLLTSFLSMLAMWASWPIHKHVKAYCILFLLLETGMLGVFMALDFFLFYVFWEVMLLPMYFLIGIWGGPRREYAAIKFFLFTLVGSVLMLVALLMLYFNSDLRLLTPRPRLEAAQLTPSRDSKPRLRRRRPTPRRRSPSTRSTSWPSPQIGQLDDSPFDQVLLGASPSSGGRSFCSSIGFIIKVPVGAAAHLAPRCPRRGPDADLDDPGRRALEDGRLRHHPHLLSRSAPTAATSLPGSSSAWAS